MFELFAVIIFIWIFWGALKLSFKITWGMAKIVASLLLFLALPVLIGALLFAGGILLLIPIILIGIAWGLLKSLT